MNSSRDVADLHPLFRPVAQSILEAAQARIGDSAIRPLSTFRSLVDQAAAKAAGKSRVSLGWHQMGLALDVGIFTPAGVYVTDGKDSRYRQFGQAVTDHGCVWGGNWINFPDPAHCEWHPGFSLTMYLAWLDAHRVATA